MLIWDTRLPRYIRGRREIVTNRGNFVFPDTVAHGLTNLATILCSFESDVGSEEGRMHVYRPVG